MSPLLVIAMKELRDAGRGRWLVTFTITFAGVALLLSLVQGQAGDLGSQGFNRMTAGLINLCLLLVPLVALVLGAGAIAGERDRGTLMTLRAQPISATGLLLGKYLGLAVALWAAVACGFGAAGVLMALLRPVTDLGHYFLFVLLSCLLATAMLSCGMLISVVSEGRVKALTGAIVLWFVMVLFYDLGAIGFALAVSSSGRSLLLVVLANPVEAIRILAVMSLEPDLQVLGPVGAYLVEEVGIRTSVALLAGALVCWHALPLVAAARLFEQRDV